MLLNISIGVAILLTIFLIVAATRPAAFRFERSITLSAPPSVALSYINDLHRWQEMSPYMALDPAARYTFAGPPAGVGASMAWVGNNKIGQGKITVIENRPDELVRMKLEFLKPFACNNTAEFTAKLVGNQTHFTWAMFGESTFMSKAMGLIVNMDKMIGSQFEEGLANLKRLAEAEVSGRKRSASFAEPHPL